MSNRIFNIITFTNLAGGATSSQNHLLSVNGVPLVPDFVWGNNTQFSVSANSTSVTVTNNGAGAATINVFCCWLHSILREFGSDATLTLTPDPYILIGGGQGGLPSGDTQRFIYTATGIEGTDFNVSLPAARATDSYAVFYTLDGVTNIVTMDFPDVLAGDRTTTQFRVILSGALTAGDKIVFEAVDLT